MRIGRSRAWAAALLVPAALALPAAATAASQPAGSVRLSDGRTYAYWAQPQHREAVRRAPSTTAKRVARLHFNTEEGYPEVYPTLRRFTDGD
ncbi:MAG: hypothetical protein ACR2JN_10215, partial [Lapillicoccus sp.]